MADALPPNIEVVALKSFARDIELTIRTQVKSGTTKRTTVVDVKKWLDAALVSPSDTPKALTAKSQRTGPAVTGDDFDFTLATLHDAVSRRLSASADAGVAPLKAWLLDEVVRAMDGRATLEVKGGEVRKATTDELREWLAATEQPVRALPAKK